MVKISVLSNGIRVVLEEIPYVRSISLGIWVKNGSVNESKELNGISHYIEHMLFKGTKKRTAKDIAEEMDMVGGQINAYTTKEYTCYHTRTLDNHFDTALDVISDMFLNSNFDDEDIKKEYNVILEEISMYEDAPEEIVHEILQKEIWKDDSVGMPILGTKDTIENFNQKIFKEYLKDHYRTDNTVISVTGNFDSTEIIKKLEKAFGVLKVRKSNENLNQNVKYFPSIITKEKDIEQVHLILAFPGINREDKRKYAYTIFNTIFGGGMSSELFQRIREENGLTYSIYSYLSQYTDAGTFAIYAGMNPIQTSKVLKLIFEVIGEIKSKGISPDVLTKTKEQIISNFIISNESIVNKMTNNGGSILLKGKIKTQEETIANIEKVSVEDVKNVIEELFDFEKLSIAAVGKIEDINFKKIVAECLNA